MMGMDIYSPQTKEFNRRFFSELMTGYSLSFPVGVTRVGTDIFWYSSKTGLEFDYKSYSNECLQLTASKFLEVECNTREYQHIICESIERLSEKSTLLP